MTYYDIVLKGTGSAKRQRFIRAPGARAALLALAVIGAALLLPSLLRMSTLDGSTATIYGGFGIAIVALRRIRPEGELQPSDRGGKLVSLAVCWLAMAYMLGAADRFGPYGLQSFLTEAWGRGSDMSRLREDLPLLGLICASICAAAAFAIRVRQARREAERCKAELRLRNEQLAQLQGSVEQLEQRLERRTAELAMFGERAGRLAEMAEMAEMAVLDERSRIAHEIHDVVGHTMTAAIVQLEATKRIAEQQQRVPWEKLELLSGLMQKGLNDIRSAVRLMRSDEAPTLRLEAELRELIQYTEDTMEIAIEADIALFPKPELGRMAEQMLYHALQEGLTNGIRHGRCKRARFSLRVRDGKLRFRLVSDGEPYGSAVPGFGLSSMIERVKLLNGEVDVRSAADAAGNPVGCALSIDLPLDLPLPG